MHGKAHCLRRTIPPFALWLVVVAAISFTAGYAPFPWSVLISTLAGALPAGPTIAVMGLAALAAGFVLLASVGNDIDRRRVTTVLPWLLAATAASGIVVACGQQGWLFPIVAAASGHVAFIILPAVSLAIVPAIAERRRWVAANAGVLLCVHGAVVLGSLGTAPPSSSTASGWWLEAAYWAYPVLAVLATTALLALRPVAVGHPTAEGWFAGLMAGWRFVVRSRSFLALIAASAMVLAATGLMSKMFYRMLAHEAAVTLDLFSGWGIVTAAAYAAGIASVIAVPSRMPISRGAFLVLSVAALASTMVALHPALRSTELLVGACAMLSGCAGAWLPLRATLLQEATPETMRGRCSAVLVVTEAVAGSLMVLVGAPSVVGACALVFLGATAALLLFWRFASARTPPVHASSLNQ
jgi:hypothetical protein